VLYKPNDQSKQNASVGQLWRSYSPIK
jgi:hypothetical protein